MTQKNKCSWFNTQKKIQFSSMSSARRQPGAPCLLAPWTPQLEYEVYKLKPNITSFLPLLIHRQPPKSYSSVNQAFSFNSQMYMIWKQNKEQNNRGRQGEKCGEQMLTLVFIPFYLWKMHKTWITREKFLLLVKSKKGFFFPLDWNFLHFKMFCYCEHSLWS